MYDKVPKYVCKYLRIVDHGASNRALFWPDKNAAEITPLQQEASANAGPLKSNFYDLTDVCIYLGKATSLKPRILNISGLLAQ